MAVRLIPGLIALATAGWAAGCLLWLYSRRVEKQAAREVGWPTFLRLREAHVQAAVTYFAYGVLVGVALIVAVLERAPWR